MVVVDRMKGSVGVNDLRTHLSNRLEGIAVTTYKSGELSLPMPESRRRIVDRMVDAVIDLAGTGELLKSIDRMYRNE